PVSLGPPSHLLSVPTRRSSDLHLTDRGVMAEIASYCAELLRRQDSDRYLTALFAPSDRREALFALYAFNLEIARAREAVSEPFIDRKSTRLNSSHQIISYAVFC